MFDSILYIIGNGFDRHHDVASGYDSFRDWLKRNNYELFSIYSAVCEYDGLWSDFEKGMAYINRDYFIEAGALGLPDSKKDPDDYSMADYMLAGDFSMGMVEELLQNLRFSFHNWIKSVRTPKSYESKKLMIDTEARFFTFNYTDFLETKYGIPHENIKYIHGHKYAKRGTLVVGHAEDSDQLYHQWYSRKRYSKPRYNKKGRKYYVRDDAWKAYNSELPEYSGIAEAAESYYEESRKPVEDIIAQNQAYFSDLYDVRIIYVWGFSFNKVDIPYLKKIIASNDYPDDIKWNVSYYSEDERGKFGNILSELGVDVDRQVRFRHLASWQLPYINAVQHYQN